jgi:transposase-like protein
MILGAPTSSLDRAFKYETICWMDEGKPSVKDIANDLNIHPNVPHQWRRKYRADMEQAFSGEDQIVIIDVIPLKK